MFRTTDVLDPRALGGTFKCRDSKTTNVLNILNPFLDTLGSEETFKLCNEYRNASSSASSLRVQMGVANNLQFNSTLADEPVRFAGATYNLHRNDIQHTLSYNVFDSNDDRFIPNYRLEYAFGQYSLTKYQSKQKVQRVQVFGRFEDYDSEGSAIEVGLRSFVPVSKYFNLELELEHRFDRDSEERTELVLTYYHSNLANKKTDVRLDFGFERANGAIRSSFYRAELSKRFQFSRFYAQVFFAPIYDKRGGRDSWEFESGVSLGRLLVRRHSYSPPSRQNRVPPSVETTRD